MDFDLNSEQQQLADAIARWAEKDYSFEKRKQIISTDAVLLQLPQDHDLWWVERDPEKYHYPDDSGPVRGPRHYGL